VGSGLKHGGTDPHHKDSNRGTTASTPAGSPGGAGLKGTIALLASCVLHENAISKISNYTKGNSDFNLAKYVPRMFITDIISGQT
jgi:hypothetical protein